MNISVSKFFLFRTQSYWMRPILMTSFRSSAKTPFPNTVTSTGTGGWEYNTFWRDTDQPTVGGVRGKGHWGDYA